jgi:hypothetical protein
MELHVEAGAHGRDAARLHIPFGDEFEIHRTLGLELKGGLARSVHRAESNPEIGHIAETVKHIVANHAIVAQRDRTVRGEIGVPPQFAA